MENAIALKDGKELIATLELEDELILCFLFYEKKKNFYIMNKR